MYWGYKLKKESCQSMRFSNSGNVNVRMPILVTLNSTSLPKRFFPISRQPKSEDY